MDQWPVARHVWQVLNIFALTQCASKSLSLSLNQRKNRSCVTLQRQNAENLKQIFPEKEYRGLSPNFHIHVSVSELYIPTVGLPFLLEEICGYINRS